MSPKDCIIVDNDIPKPKPSRSNAMISAYPSISCNISPGALII
ncbi:MAG: hypothetical protein QXJ69_01050 [Desulfurococcaceae archaeon]